MIYDPICALGRSFDNDVLASTRALFADIPLRGATAVQKRSLPYGTDDRQQLDVYWAQGQNCPVLILVPGGGFVAGSRFSYERFGWHFAELGFVVVIADYRLAPAWQWPAAAQDVSLALNWAMQNVAEFGGSRTSIFVFGHSAGATHVASALLDRRHRADTHNAVAGWILMSGIYSVQPDETRPNVLSYFGQDRALFADRSPASHVSETGAPLLLMFAEYDPAHFVVSAFNLGKIVTQSWPFSPEIRSVARHNHISPILAAGTPYDPITKPIRAFVDRHRSTQPE